MQDMKRHPNAARLHPADMARIGAHLRSLRQDLKLSQQAVAEALGCHSTNVTLIEKGRASVSIAQLAAFAHLVGRKPGQLITEILHELSLTRYGRPLGTGSKSKGRAA